jgi:hypothetical protein
MQKRKVIFISQKTLEYICNYLRDGPLFRNIGKNSVNPSKQVSRQNVAHPKIINYENESVSLKYLILLDSLAHILTLDRITSGEFFRGKFLTGIIPSSPPNNPTP